MSQSEAKTFCRICPGFCGLKVTIEDHRIVAIRGDKDHPVTAGYICSKANLAIDMMHGEGRIRRPLARRADGSFTEIPLEQALDEIAARLGDIMDRESPEAVAMYRGTANGLNLPATLASLSFLQALGTTQNYSSMTVDQSAKWVAEGRLGAWHAGKQHMDHSDVLMLFGTNPLVSVLGGLNNFVPLNPVKRLKEAKQRGMRLIVIDPRRSETADHADIFLQPLPGHDAAIAAAMIRTIFAEGWHDRAFCATYVDGVAALERAVQHFTPDRVAEASGIAAAELVAATRAFAVDAKTGSAASGTGPNMAPQSNLAEHMIELLNVVCGRYARAGARVVNPGALSPPEAAYAEVIPPARPWLAGPRSHVRDVGTLHGERMSGLLTDEILNPGPDRIRALISAGGNPASALPDQAKITKALQSLELLVCVEPFMTTTAQLAHYVLPPKLLHERMDIPPIGFYERALYPRPFAQMALPLVPPPPGSEVVDDSYIYWSLAKRLGKPMQIAGADIDMNRPLTPEGVLEPLLKHSRVSFADLLEQPDGILLDLEEYVLPAREGADRRFDVMPEDIADELVLALRRLAKAPDPKFPFLLTVRRMREVVNTTGHDLPAVRRRLATNPAFMSPTDMLRLELVEGQAVAITSATGSVMAFVQPDERVRPGVVSISHGWGRLPGSASDSANGACTNLLVSSETGIEAINAMPTLSAIPIAVQALSHGREA